MRKYRPVILVDEMREVVDKVSAELLPSLQAYDENITGVHYLHGHPLEIIKTLAQRDKSDSFVFKKYPLIALFQDFPEAMNATVGIPHESTLHLIIARATRPDFTAPERYDKNFRPVLYPIYSEFLHQLHHHGAFITKSETQIQHIKTDRLYWGNQGLYGNEGNIFNDWIDCMEITNLRLKVKTKLC